MSKVILAKLKLNKSKVDQELSENNLRKQKLFSDLELLEKTKNNIETTLNSSKQYLFQLQCLELLSIEKQILFIKKSLNKNKEIFIKLSQENDRLKNLIEKYNLKLRKQRKIKTNCTELSDSEELSSIKFRKLATF